MHHRNWAFNRRYLTLLVSILALLVVGARPEAAFSCQRSADSQLVAHLDQPFQLHWREQIVIRGTDSSPDLTLQFLDVLDDSRCPADVQCVWAGQVRVGLQASLASDPTEDLTLTQGGSPNTPSTTTLGPYQIQLNEVSPYPSTQSPIADDAYIVTLTVTSVAF